MDINEAIGSITTLLNDTTKLDNVGSVLFTDPWEQATGNTRTAQFFDEKFELVGKFPKGNVVEGTDEMARLTYGKDDYKDEETLVVNIYYFTKPDQKFTGVNGTEYKDAKLVKYYLNRVRRGLKMHSGSFTEMHRMNFGTVSNVLFDPDRSLYYGMVPVSFVWTTGSEVN